MDDAVSKALQHTETTRVVEVGRGVLTNSGRIINDLLVDEGKPGLLVADERTWQAAGAAAATSRSKTTTRGAGQGMVIFNPPRVIGAPNPV